MARAQAKPNTPTSSREREILYSLAFGYSKKETAERLYIKYQTVRSTTYNILIRTGAHNLGHAVAILITKGEICTPAPPEEPEPLLKPGRISILTCLARGLTVNETVEELGRPYLTVKNNIRRLYEILDAETRPQLIYRGFETGNLIVRRRATP